MTRGPNSSAGSTVGLFVCLFVFIVALLHFYTSSIRDECSSTCKDLVHFRLPLPDSGFYQPVYQAELRLNQDYQVKTDLGHALSLYICRSLSLSLFLSLSPSVFPTPAFFTRYTQVLCYCCLTELDTETGEPVGDKTQ